MTTKTIKTKYPPNVNLEPFLEDCSLGFPVIVRGADNGSPPQCEQPVGEAGSVKLFKHSEWIGLPHLSQNFPTKTELMRSPQMTHSEFTICGIRFLLEMV
jgi:hypothetical protein